MNKLETNITTFMYIFIMYFYINITFQFKSDKWINIIARLKFLKKNSFYWRGKKINFSLFLRQILMHMDFCDKNGCRIFNEKLPWIFLVVQPTWWWAVSQKKIAYAWFKQSILCIFFKLLFSLFKAFISKTFVCISTYQ